MMLWMTVTRFWKTSSSASTPSWALREWTSRWYCMRWCSNSRATDFQTWSYCSRNSFSSCRTVTFRFSRNVEVFASCRFSTLLNASRRMRDCSSMYRRERVEFDSSICSRLWTDLKKDSWVVGFAEGGCVFVGLVDSEGGTFDSSLALVVAFPAVSDVVFCWV